MLMEISEQHQELCNILHNKKTHLYIVMGPRSTGKSHDTSNIANAKLNKNIKDYLKGGDLKKICLMRQSQSDVTTSIYAQFLKSYYHFRSKNAFSFDRYLEVLETTIKITKDDRSDNLIIKKGFRASNKTNTAGTKSIVDINTYIIEEAEEIMEHDFDKLYLTAIRENAQIVLILNTPHQYHWIIRKYFNIIPYPENPNYFIPVQKTNPRLTYIKSTIQGNCFLDEETLEQYMAFGDKNNEVDYNEHKYHVDILGLVASNAQGRIIKDYTICTLEEFEAVEKKEKLGMDFGFTNDPTALVRTKVSNDTIYIDELMFGFGMSVPSMAYEMNQKKVDKSLIVKYDTGDGGNRVADELHKKYGFNMVPAIKGTGSVVYGTEKLSKMRIVVTERSINVIHEFQNHVYETKTDGKHSNQPKDSYNHTIDAIRYTNEDEPSKVTEIKDKEAQDFLGKMMNA